MPTFTLPPGFAATKVHVFADPETSRSGPWESLLARTGGPWATLGIVGFVAAGAGGLLLLLWRRR